MERKARFRAPRLGMRTIKTAISVFACMLISFLIYRQISSYAAIVAVVCMQSTIENTLNTSINRLVGTAIGGGFGMLFLLITQTVTSEYLFMVLLPVGTIAVIYFCNLIRMLGSSTIGAILFISVFIAPLLPVQNMSPYGFALSRVVDTVIGIVVTMAINRYVAPAQKYEPKTVHLTCETYPAIYRRIKERLVGNEALLLYDSSLACESTRTHGVPGEEGDATVRLPVPMEYTKEPVINIAYVDSAYDVFFFEGKNEAGYVEIPPQTLPCTVVWRIRPNEMGLRLKKP